MNNNSAENTNVAYQGIEGSFSNLAMLEYFKGQVEGRGQTNFKSIFTSLNEGASKHAIVPVENSLAGSVYEIYDLLLDFECHVIGEHYYKVNHALLSPPGGSAAKIERIYSHPKALEQCQNYFSQNPALEKIFYSDTASAAKFVSESKNPKYAAIASKQAAKLYNLELIKENIEDNPHNYTRFLILSAGPSYLPSADKCSLIFTLPHKPQSLFKAIEFLSDQKINICKIESRPIHGKPFEYVFYIDFDFENPNLEFVKSQLKKFQEKVNFYKLLGLYKKAQPLV
jgi:prephenate dehydratase